MITVSPVPGKYAFLASDSTWSRQAADDIGGVTGVPTPPLYTVRRQDVSVRAPGDRRPCVWGHDVIAVK